MDYWGWSSPWTFPKSLGIETGGSEDRDYATRNVRPEAVRPRNRNSIAFWNLVGIFLVLFWRIGYFLLDRLGQIGRISAVSNVHEITNFWGVHFLGLRCDEHGGHTSQIGFDRIRDRLQILIQTCQAGTMIGEVFLIIA